MILNFNAISYTQDAPQPPSEAEHDVMEGGQTAQEIEQSVQEAEELIDRMNMEFGLQDQDPGVQLTFSMTEQPSGSGRIQTATFDDGTILEFSDEDWNGNDYSTKYEIEWPGEGMLIESLNIGDVDNDGFPEVCAGTNIIHILQWDGENYIEEGRIEETYGDLAVLNIGDCDNDGKNEINAAPVFVEDGVDYITWIFKYGWEG